MEHCVNHHKELDFDNANLDDAEEEWTEPVNEGMKGRQNDHHHHENGIPLSKMGHSRTIIHFDIDCFYAQVEMLRNPELRNKPLGIQQKNIVITTNYIARNCGVPKSTYVTDAKKICPELVLVCGEDLTNYRQMSYQISEFLQKYTACVERLGFDENFVDVSELVIFRLKDGKYKNQFVGHVYSSGQQGISKPLCNCGCEIRMQIGSQIAADIREALKKELGITCCAGVGHNKLLAKLVAGTHKPNQQTSVLPHMALELMSSLSSVICIPGIGFTTSRRLNACGISSVLDLQASDKKMLEKEFGSSMVELMVQLSYGVDDSPVTAYSQPQTLSDEDSFKCCNDFADAECKIRDLLISLMKRVMEDGRVPQTVRLIVRRVSNKYHRESKQCPVPGNIFTKCLHSYVTEAVVERLMPLLLNLFRKLVDPSKPFHLTLLGVSFAKLVKPADELRSIGSFFVRGEAFSQSGKNNLDLSEKDVDNQYENVCQSISTSSPLKSELKIKSESKIKTLKHFFLKENETKGSTENLIDASASQYTLPHESIISLPEIDVKEKSINTAPLHSTEECTDSDHVLKAAVIKTTHIREFESVPDLPDRCFTQTEQDVSKVQCLQDLLPADVDVHTIAELPVDIQKEVLLQYGIYVEDFPQQRFTRISDKIRTRSHNIPNQATVHKSLHSPRKKQTPKRNPEFGLLCSEPADRISKRRRTLCMDEVPDTNPVTCLPLNFTKSRIGEHSAKLLSKTLNSPCAKNESLPCVKDLDDNIENYVLPVTGNDTTVQYSRESSTDEHLSCADNISEFPSNQFDGTNLCIPHNQHAGKPVVSCEPHDQHAGRPVVSCEPHDQHAGRPDVRCDTDTYEDFKVEYPSHNMPDGQGVSSDISVTCSPHNSLQSCSTTYVLSSQSNQSNADGQGVSPDISVTCPPHNSLQSCSTTYVLSSQSNQGNADGQGVSPDISVISPPSHISVQPCSSTSVLSSRSCQRNVHQNKLPSNIDSEVFLSLPSNIQGEIMAHIIMGSSDSVSGEHATNEIPERQRNLKQTKTLKHKNQNTLLTYFKRNDTENKKIV